MINKWHGKSTKKLLPINNLMFKKQVISQYYAGKENMEDKNIIRKVLNNLLL